jgi:hypothetical protein
MLAPSQHLPQSLPVAEVEAVPYLLEADIPSPTKRSNVVNALGTTGQQQEPIDLGRYRMAELSESFEERMLRSLQREQEEELSDLEVRSIIDLLILRNWTS